MKSSPRATLAGFCLILTASLASGWLARALSPDPLPWKSSWTTPVEEQVLEAGFEVVDTSQARRLLEEGTHLFLDARSLAEYDHGQLPGAMPLPFQDFDEHYPDLAPILEPHSPLVTYCSNPECDLSLRLAERLRDAGHTRVKVYVAGYYAWIEEEAQ